MAQSSDVGAAVPERDRQVRGLGRHVQAGGDADALERLLARKRSRISRSTGISRAAHSMRALPCGASAQVFDVALDLPVGVTVVMKRFSLPVGEERPLRLIWSLRQEINQMFRFKQVARRRWAGARDSHIDGRHAQSAHVLPLQCRLMPGAPRYAPPGATCKAEVTAPVASLASSATRVRRGILSHDVPVSLNGLQERDTIPTDLAGARPSRQRARSLQNG